MVVELVLAAIFTGFVSGFFGVGGGMVLVPILLYLGINMKYAIGISAMQMLFSASYGSYLNYKKGKLDPKNGLYVGLGGFLGALFSGYIVNSLSSNTLEIFFFGVVVFATYRFFKAPHESPLPPVQSKPLMFAIGLCIGLFASSLGIGGALVLTPTLVAFLRFEIKQAVSASLFFVVFTSTAGFASLSYFGFVEYDKGLIVGIFSLLGVYAGIAISHKTDPKRLKNFILALDIIILLMIGKRIFL